MAVVAWLLLWVPAQEHEWVTKLRSESIAEREEAERRLKEMGEAARPHLEKAARDPDRELAARAAHLLRILELRARFSPRLRKALPGIEEKLARDDGPAWAEALLAGAELKKGAREFPVLKGEDLSPLAAAALRAAPTAEDRKWICDVVRKRSLTTAIPELLRLLEGEDAMVALYTLEELGSAEAAPAVAALLRHPDPQHRRGAANTLVALVGGEAAGDLAPLLKDSEPAVRREALYKVAHLGAREVVPDVLLLLKDDSPLVREAAAYAAGQLASGHKAAEAVAALLSDSYPGVRISAVWALAGLQSVAHVRSIVPLLKDSGKVRTDSVGEAAAGALAVLGATDHFRELVAFMDSSPGRAPDGVLAFFREENRDTWVPALEEKLADPDPSVAGAAGVILCKLRSKEALPKLLRLLEEGPPVVRRRLSKVFWEFPDPSAVPVFVRRTRDEDPAVRGHALLFLRAGEREEEIAAARRLLGDPDAEVRRSAVNTFFGSTALPVADLMPLLKDSEAEIAQHAFALLSQSGAREVIPEARERLSDPVESWRSRAAWTLASLGDRESVPGLMKLLKDPVHSVRAAAAEAVGRLGARDRLADLRPLLADGTARVRMGAMRALAMLEDRESIPAVRKIMKGDDWLDARREAAEWLCRFGVDEGVPLILEHAYDLWALNALRTPETWRRLEGLKVTSDGEGPLAVLLGRLEKEVGLKIRLPEPRPRFEGEDHVRFGNPRGDLSFRDALGRLLHPQAFPHGVIVEADQVRIVGPEEEYDFWADWWAARKR